MLVCCPLFERPLLHHRLLVVMYIHTGLGGLSRSSPVEVVVAVIGSGGRGHRRLADASGTAGEGGELGECRCGATPTAVEERSVVPSAETRVLGVVLRPPPEEAVDLIMLVEHGDEVADWLSVVGIVCGSGLLIAGEHGDVAAGELLCTGGAQRQGEDGMRRYARIFILCM